MMQVLKSIPLPCYYSAKSTAIACVDHLCAVDRQWRRRGCMLWRHEAPASHPQESEQMENEMRELEALLEYLVKHNGDHAGEIMDLATRAQALDKTEVYDHLVRGVELLNESNESLRTALTVLRG
jgi:hypothetical protein